MLIRVGSSGVLESFRPSNQCLIGVKSVGTVKPFRIVETVRIVRHVGSVWTVDLNINLSLVLTILTFPTQQTLSTFQSVSTVSTL